MLMNTLLGLFLIVFQSSFAKIDTEAHCDDVKLLEPLLQPEETEYRRARRKSDERRWKDDDLADQIAEGDPHHGSDWHFGYQNIPEWGQHFPDCSGKRQSPIDLIPSMMKPMKLPSLRWNGYGKLPRSMTLSNNGHSVELSGVWDFVPTVSGGVLNGEYGFHQLHFHWGSSDNTGSEHTIDNRSFPLEMHMVHYKKSYGSASEAMKHEDGLAVIGVLFQTRRSGSQGLANMLQYARSIQTPNSKVQIRPFPLTDFHVRFRGEYVTYLGSLTTPPCSEIVTWIVSASPRYMSQEHINAFRKLQISGGDDHNYRPTMPLNGREVRYITL